MRHGDVTKIGHSYVAIYEALRLSWGFVFVGTVQKQYPPIKRFDDARLRRALRCLFLSCANPASVQGIV